MKFNELLSVLHKGTLVEIGGQGVPDSNNPNIYSGNVEEMPKELVNILNDAEVAAVDASSTNEYTVRVEVCGVRLNDLPEHLQHLMD